ncbi:J domain-containing protein [Iamia sp. SCSIO 61187]|uniref:J domain-containing protein n=1 Tax=Iamia sp. SCSIO 61187 TaxID=2722752 RepID=UPI001C63235B|nr:J domain-containing protein [Iamia sp. SCSIO 61187]QYG93033.1 J domain-containing protein [Iamia sp. SCSIO 61187]
MTRDEAARLLGVAPDATATEVRTAFRVGVRQQHPDRSGRPGSVAVSRLVEARRTLLAPVVAAAPRPAPAPPRPAVPLDARVEGDTLLVRADLDTVVARLVEAGHALGEITYLDRSAGLVEVLLQVQEEGDLAPAACSLVVSLQSRLDGVEVFATVERLDGHLPPPVAPIVAALATAMGVAPT